MFQRCFESKYVLVFKLSTQHHTRFWQGVLASSGPVRTARHLPVLTMMEFSYSTVSNLELIGRLTIMKEKEQISDSSGTPFRALTLLSPHIAKICTQLNLSKCEMTDIPDTIGLFYGLKSLNLSNNQIEMLPVQVGKLFSLRSFDCSRNQLKALPDEINCLVHLERLLIQNNQLVALPDGVSAFTDLKELNVFNNKILQVQPVLGTLGHAEKICFASNRLMQILPNAIASWSSVKVLNIFDCRILFLPSLGHMASLEELRAYGNHLQSVPDFGRGLVSLKQLSLQRNSIREVPTGFFPSIPNLERINLSENLLDALPSDLRGQRLSSFQAAQNRIREVPESIGELPALRNLFLQSNVLSSLPRSLLKISTLKRVDLARNSKITAALTPENKQILDHLKRLCKSADGGRGKFTAPNSL